MRKRPAALFVWIMATSLSSCATVQNSGDFLSGGPFPHATEKQITSSRTGHILTNFGVWSADGKRLAYDIRSVPDGTVFDGSRIGMVDVDSGKIEVLYESKGGAFCGVVTCNPVEDKVVFIHGPENPTVDWQYGFTHRRGVITDRSRPGIAVNMDACDLTPPFTPGALRGGSHVHVFSGDGKWVSFTYQDEVLSHFPEQTADHDNDLRNVGVSVPARPVEVSENNPRNHDGSHFTVLVTRTTANPKPGSDEVSKAFEDAWIGTEGYLRPDGSRQKRALAIQGNVVTESGQTIAEVYVVDLPDDLTIPGDGPLEGTATRRPLPPKGVSQRRLTRTASRKFPGIQGTRHWLRSSPDGSQIAFLMKDDAGVVQLWTISPNGGEPQQVSHNPWDIGSCYSWSPDGRFISHVMDNSVFVTEVSTGKSHRLTPRRDDATAPRPEACVFSPDGTKIAYARQVPMDGKMFNQIFVVAIK